MKWYILETGKLDDNGLYYDKQIIGNNRIIAAMPYKSIDNYDTIADDRLFNDESDKYAALIAAAPELLEACKKALNVFESEPDLSFYKAHKELIKSAIAKAEGK